MSHKEASEEQIITSPSLHLWAVTSSLLFFSFVQAFFLLYLEAFQLYCIMSQHLMLNMDVKGSVESANLIENYLSIQSLVYQTIRIKSSSLCRLLWPSTAHFDRNEPRS